MGLLLGTSIFVSVDAAVFDKDELKIKLNGSVSLKVKKCS